MTLRFFPLAILLIQSIALAAFAQSGGKRALDHDAYDEWKSIRGQKISARGGWVVYSLAAEDGDPTLKVKSTSTSAQYAVEGGSGGAFADDEAFAVFLIKPKKEDVRRAERDEVKEDEQPKSALGILDLATGKVTRVERVKGFKLPKKGSGWVAYLKEKPPKEEGEDAEGEEESEGTEEEKAPEEGEALTEAEKKAEKKEKKKREKKAEGTELVLRALASGEERHFDNAVEYAFSESGNLLVFTTSNKDGDADGAFAIETASGEQTDLLAGEGVYKQIAIDQAGAQVAFVSNRDDYPADQPAFTLYHWTPGDTDARIIATTGAPGMRGDWQVSEHRAPNFSESGARLFFGAAPPPAPEPDDDQLDEEKVKVDIWNWRDPLLQPMQLKRKDDEIKRSFLAMIDLASGAITQLADEEVPEVTVAAKGDGATAMGTSNLPYRQLISWDSPGYSDIYWINTDTGDRRLAIEKLQGSAALSPEGKYFSWWDRAELQWFAIEGATGRKVNLTQTIPHRLDDEHHDTPSTPRPYGAGGWTKGDTGFIVYDKYDLWLCDPNGMKAAICITDQAGRVTHRRFRYTKLDPEADAIDPGEPLLLAAFDTKTRAAGFFRDNIGGANQPQKLIMMDRSFGRPAKAREADRLIFTRQSFEEFPDLWTSDLELSNARRLSHANPQQSDYLWGSAELVSWDSAKGEPLEGILIKPEGFDPARKYPMMVYFYERLSNSLHRHHPPQTARSSISYGFYASRGYLVFVPDIPYREGYPGESAMQAVVPGVLSLIGEGFVDREHIGVQGHSWGGYQIAYMVTRTNLFAAAEAGAPVSNMISAYGGIRWSSGMSRMFQYERTQSRIGGSLWEQPMRFIENSPIFWADKIETPVLMMHNDNDGSVPWYQGIEMFVAMRRLGKPVWMFNYNGEDHGLAKYPNKRDWAIRMQQFFDHYLQGAPAPEWLAEGVPAVRKGLTLGLDLVD